MCKNGMCALNGALCSIPFNLICNMCNIVVDSSLQSSFCVFKALLEFLSLIISATIFTVVLNLLKSNQNTSRN